MPYNKFFHRHFHIMGCLPHLKESSFIAYGALNLLQSYVAAQLTPPKCFPMVHTIQCGGCPEGIACVPNQNIKAMGGALISHSLSLGILFQR